MFCDMIDTWGIASCTGDLIPGSAGHTLLSSLSNNFFDV